MATRLDWEHTHTVVDTWSKDVGIADPTKAFHYFAISLILGLDAAQIREAITEGGNDHGIDAVYINGKSNPRTVHIFSFKYHTKPEHIDKNFPANEVGKIRSFVTDLCNRSNELVKSSNNLLAEKLQDIYQLTTQHVPLFKIHLCSNAKSLLPQERSQLDAFLSQFRTFSLTEHDLDKFSAYLLGATRIPVNKKITAVGKPFEKTNGDLRGVVASITAETLVELVKNPSLPNQINQNIFNDNVRNYLGTHNDINDRIYESAISESNYRFWYLNNGITITCSKYSFAPNFNNPVIELSDVQIVNGLQTSNAIFEAYQASPNKVQEVQLLVRIYETQDSDLSLAICEATNSQTPIRPRDMVSNKPIHKKIETILLERGYFYERKKNQYVTKDQSYRLDILKLGQIYLSYFLEDPSGAKAESDQIFRDTYDRIFNDDFPIMEVIPVIEMFRLIEIEQKKIMDEMRLVNGRQHRFSYFPYAAFHVLFSIKLLCENDDIDLGKAIGTPGIINRALEAIKHVVEANRDTSFYQLFRSPKAKREIERIIGAGEPDLFNYEKQAKRTKKNKKL